ncbi:MAG: DNA-binding response regulator [Candidatus Dadabacteria bacterium]|nr:MAG: DNA-binding response regulator [Candidatus Dadabacteria bacterium]
MMPELNGAEMLRRIRADKRISSIPVLMLTANDSEEAELDLINCGADDFVGKSTSTDILLARVRRLLGSGG